MKIHVPNHQPDKDSSGYALSRSDTPIFQQQKAHMTRNAQRHQKHWEDSHLPTDGDGWHWPIGCETWW